jgi:hypothetical protein
MLLANTTPIPAAATVRRDLAGRRILVVTAKATFGLHATPLLEVDDPEPLLAVDEPTPLGLLPADLIPRFDSAFEVITLGCAHAPEGRLLTRQLVTLTIGDVTRQLVVTGDRRWTRRLGTLVATEPQPFDRMELTWERAFGGECDAWLDADSPIPISHPLNRLGRGFDPTPMAEGLRRGLRLPEELPWLKYERCLPNIEHPDQLVVSANDAPEPAGWSTIPRELGLNLRRATLDEQMVYRAHSDWIITRPNAGAPIALFGMTPSARVATALPRLRAFVDVAGGSWELVPQMLVLLPERSRGYLVFRTALHLADGSARSRRARLRVQPGWCPPELELGRRAA